MMEKQTISREVTEELCRKAVEMRRYSYVPYSHFHVGAALLSEDGRIFTGCNVENAGYPVCTCAERTAFAKAVSEGAISFSAIAISGGPEDGELQYCPPCGVCRQVMSEFCGGDFLIYLAKAPDDYETYTLDDLMPKRFTPAHLLKDRGGTVLKKDCEEASMTAERTDISKMIDHTLLKASAEQADIRKLCAEARTHGFASVCVNSCYAKLAAEELEGTDVKTCCVVGFPLGAMAARAKAFEARCAVEDGAAEIDMVINVGALKEGRDDYVREEIRAVVESAKPAIVKVIIETCLLTDDEKRKACELSEQAGAAFVKTSTGFSTGGANAHDVALMKKAVGGRLKVKAAGGIHTPDEARALIEAGADRIGASNGVALLG